MNEDQKLRLALAKMLPNRIGFTGSHFYWCEVTPDASRIQDTEWLHICWLVEQAFSVDEAREYHKQLQVVGQHMPYNAWLWNCSWQQRAQALCKVKGIDI